MNYEHIPPYETVMYQCLNDGVCGAIFARPQQILLFGQYIDACPECHEDDFSPLLNEVVWGLFWHIVTHDFTDEEWATYRMIAQASMGPAIEPVDNDD